MVAFANSRGGTIFVGISDRRPRQILGVQWTQDLVEQVQEAARSTQPPLPVEVEPWRVDDRDIASIQVRALARGWVQTSDGRLLVRAGPTNRALVGDELLRFVRNGRRTRSRTSLCRASASTIYGQSWCVSPSAPVCRDPG
jgi:ATP-dependent DNA helicase RecG